MDYRYLPTLFAGYFHQDWRAEASDVAGVVNNFMRESTEVVEGAKQELRQLQALNLEEADVRRLLMGEWGSAFDPTLLGISMREWLMDISAILEASRE